MERYWPQVYHQRFVKNKTLLFLIYFPDALTPEFAGFWDCKNRDEKRSHDFAMLAFEVRFFVVQQKEPWLHFL